MAIRIPTFLLMKSAIGVWITALHTVMTTYFAARVSMTTCALGH
jgi:hypothetical protein